MSAVLLPALLVCASFLVFEFVNVKLKAKYFKLALQ